MNTESVSLYTYTVDAGLAAVNTGPGRAPHGWVVQHVPPAARLRGLVRYRTAVAGMTLPNEASVGLRRAMGFQPIGTYRRIGWKHGSS